MSGDNTSGLFIQKTIFTDMKPPELVLRYSFIEKAEFWYLIVWMIDLRYFCYQNNTIMKKLATAFVVFLFVALAFSSCKSFDDCPAYGQVETNIELPAKA